MDIQTRTDPVARAREVGTEIDAAADEIERTRRIPEALLGRMHDQRLSRMRLPRAAGGDETEPGVYVATRRARQQHAEQPLVMHPPQQRLGDASRAFDLVGRRVDLRPNLAGAGDRIGAGLDVHASPRTGEAIAADRSRAVNRLSEIAGSTWPNARDGSWLKQSMCTGHLSPAGRGRFAPGDAKHRSEQIG